MPRKKQRARSAGHASHEKQNQMLRELATKELHDYLENHSMNAMIRQAADPVRERLMNAFRHHLRTHFLYLCTRDGSFRGNYPQEIDAATLPFYIETFAEERRTPKRGLSETLVARLDNGEPSIDKLVAETLFEWIEDLSAIVSPLPPTVRKLLVKDLKKQVHQMGYAGKKEIMRDLTNYFTAERIERYIRQNPHYMNLFQIYDREQAANRELDQHLLDRIPDNYIDLYPQARQMKRTFILHIGPTNSGKTYQAMQALRQAVNGVYLAPLRLLAFEQFDALNRDGYPCDLWTGEEHIEVDGSVFCASTVEMADFHTLYDVAVIDEAQMLSDDDRGGAWTAALLGLRAREIHVCAAPYAEEILKRIITDCGDNVSVTYHDRQTPLSMERRHVHFPGGVKPGDAVIVFSRKNVHAVAAELQARNFKVSIIYGSLPYDVRHEEARKFNSGETEVVVATDAIGMGLNLPIHRIIFLEGSKFDGHTRRILKPEEIQQIAGRAGRFGIYDEGFVCGVRETHSLIRSRLNMHCHTIAEAVIAFPEQLIGIDGKLSDILQRWDTLPPHEGYRRASCQREIQLALELEDETDDKELIYNFITIPFTEDDETLHQLWHAFFRAELEGYYLPFSSYAPVLDLEPRTAESIAKDSVSEQRLGAFEAAYRLCDLAYFYCERFGRKDELTEIITTKTAISHRITELLAEQNLTGRTCPICGRKLAWNYPYTLCNDCYYSQY